MAARLLLGTLVLAALAGGLAWQVGGGDWQTVATPSMGAAAPVGTLVLTRPTDAEHLAVGDVVTYLPPTPTVRTTVTHRVVAVDPAPGGTTLRTRGDVNGADDPWTLHSADLVGKVVATLPGVGWLLRAVPLLVVGMVLVRWATRTWAPAVWRVPLQVLAFSLLISTAAALLRPFVGAVTLGTTSDPSGTHITMVSTGLLPARHTAATGGSVDLLDGHVGVITTRVPAGAAGSVVTGNLHMSVWLWLLMSALWLSPLAYGLVAGYRSRPSSGVPRRGPAVRRAAALGVALLALPALLVGRPLAGPTAAVFTARVANAADTAGTNPYFTCLGGYTGAGTDALVWPLDDATVTNGATARDASGLGVAGTYVNPLTLNVIVIPNLLTPTITRTPSHPCPRDTGTSAIALTPASGAPSYVAAAGTTPVAGTNAFSTAVWFSTTTTTGGRILGFGNARTGASTTADRHLYMTDAGTLVFGVNPGTPRTVTSPRAYNDGAWHLAVTTLSPAGMVLYVDGAPVAADPTTTTAGNGTGFWRVGYDALAAWPGSPSTPAWTGSVAWAGVFSSVLSATAVRQIHAAGT